MYYVQVSYAFNGSGVGRSAAPGYRNADVQFKS